MVEPSLATAISVTSDPFWITSPAGPGRFCTVHCMPPGAAETGIAAGSDQNSMARTTNRYISFFFILHPNLDGCQGNFTFHRAFVSGKEPVNLANPLFSILNVIPVLLVFYLPKVKGLEDIIIYSVPSSPLMKTPTILLATPRIYPSPLCRS